MSIIFYTVANVMSSACESGAGGSLVVVVEQVMGYPPCAEQADVGIGHDIQWNFIHQRGKSSFIAESAHESS